MNNFEDVGGLDLEARQLSNLETYHRFLIKGDWENTIESDDAKAIKEAVKGLGKVVAVADGRRTMAGNHKYVLCIENKEGVKVYLFTVLNGLYNEMGPYVDLDTALSNADCYGLFEECKEVANKKVFNESIIDDEDEMTYDGEMEDIKYIDDDVFDDGRWDGVDAADASFDDDNYDIALPYDRSTTYILNSSEDNDILDTPENYNKFTSPNDNWEDPDASMFADFSGGGNAVESVDYDPFEESQKQMFDKLLNEEFETHHNDYVGE